MQIQKRVINKNPQETYPSFLQFVRRCALLDILCTLMIGVAASSFQQSLRGLSCVGTDRFDLKLQIPDFFTRFTQFSF